MQASIPIDYSGLTQMAWMLKHRGPDESGIYIDDNAGLVSTRLKIIDLYGGTQPIHNEDENLWIVYNGEIFNYVELKNGLKSHHKFYTQTDTEVILHLYEEKGSGCLNDLNGEFAFAIYDKKKRELFIARDRFGIKPFFYTINNAQFFFGSEIKSIFTQINIPRKINPIALDQIFTFWTTIPGITVFEDIQELPPGHFMKVSSQIKISRYWDIPFTPACEQYKKNIDVFSHELYEILLDAVRIRLRSDVPVGCYISGGLDSSGIVSIIKNNFKNNVSTYGIGFEDNSFDESTFQREIVEYLNVCYTNVMISNDEISELFPEVIWYCEKPILRTAPAPMLLLSKLVHKAGIKVIMTGEGSDEVFGGYDIFQETKARLFWAKRPGSILRSLLLRNAHDLQTRNNKISPLATNFYKSGIDEPENIFFSHLIRWKNNSKIKNLFSTSLQLKLKGYNCYNDLKTHLPEEYCKWDYLSKAQYLEIILFLNNYLLSSQGDRMAMASSVETRLPYLDYRIIEHMAKAPVSWKIKGMQEKYILKNILKNILPGKTIHREKYPYRAPVISSLLCNKNDKFLDRNIFRDTDFFDIDRVQKLWNKLSQSNNSSELDSMAVAGILSTQHLYKQFNKICKYSGKIPINVIHDKRCKYSYV